MSTKPVHALPGPDDILRHELENGIVVLARPNFNSPSVVISGYLAVGSLLDSDEYLGLANYVAASLMRGTRQRSFQEIFNALESVGASLGFSSGTHSTSFGGKALVEDLDLVFELLQDTLMEPIFPEEQIERLRVQYLTALTIRAQDTSAMASLEFDQKLYTGHPYARPEDGYIETISAIGREDLIQFHSDHYGPQGMVITIAGGIDPQEAMAKVEKAFGSWHNIRQQNIPATPAIIPLQSPVREHVQIAGKSQTDLIMGCLGPERGSPDYLPAALGNNILGQFGMYGRIGERVREQAGLAYYAYSSLSSGIDTGAWYAAAGVDPKHVEETIDMILDEIHRFITIPVTDEELSDSQANFIGKLPLRMESNAGVANSLTQLERYKLGLDYYQRYAGLVNEVTPECILDTAKKYLNTNQMVIVSAGTKNRNE